MKLINAMDNGRVYRDARKWAMDMKKALERDLVCYEKEYKEFMSEDKPDQAIEPLHMATFIHWFLRNYYD